MQHLEKALHFYHLVGMPTSLVQIAVVIAAFVVIHLF